LRGAILMTYVKRSGKRKQIPPLRWRAYRALRGLLFELAALWVVLWILWR